MDANNYHEWAKVYLSINGKPIECVGIRVHEFTFLNTDQLKQKELDLVDSEEFEKAAIVRDEIKRREQDKI